MGVFFKISLAYRWDYYNKWNMITRRDKNAEEVYWKPNDDKGKVRVDAVQISKCKSTDEYTDVDPMTLPKDQRKHIVRVVDICDFIDVYGTATIMSILNKVIYYHFYQISSISGKEA